MVDKNQAITTHVGFFSFTTGFVAFTTNIFDEVRKNPEAVCAYLMHINEWDLAGWVMDNFVSSKVVRTARSV